MTYQDIWSNGWLLKKGNRECPSRYEIVKKACIDLGLNDRFSVCDIGANMLYFSLRLNQDFGCKVVAFEHNCFAMRERHLKLTRCKDIMLINRRLCLNDLYIMKNMVNFDLILALSVLHHVPENKLDWLSAMLEIGKNVIVEFALEDSKRKDNILGYIEYIHSVGKILGYGASHLNKDIQRPIVLLDRKAIANVKQ